MRVLCACFLSLVFLHPSYGQTRYYVKQNGGNDANSGLDWQNAFATLQKALGGIADDDTIWVATGTYYPDEGGAAINDDRSSSFYLYKGVNVFGGFQGNELEFQERDLTMYPTILSGDLQQNDGPNFTNNGDNSYHVVVCANQNKVSSIDGFTIEGGNANFLSSNYFLGAGMFNLNADPRVLNCIFQANYSISSGGGMENSSADTYLEDCRFMGNVAVNGGGMYNINASIIVNSCHFVGNMASSGAGMYNYGASLTVQGSVFDQNIADTGDPNTLSTGGGIYNFSQSRCEIFNSSLLGNFAQFGGGLHNTNSQAFCHNVVFLGNHANLGGGLYNAGDSARLINCSFSGNRADFDGGAIRNHLSSPILINTLIWNNADQTGVGAAGASMSTIGGVPIMTYCLIQNITVALGGNLDGITDANNNNYPLFIEILDPLAAPTSTGNLRLLPGSPVLNVGSNADVESFVDADGQARFNGIVDLGAYENPLVNCPKDMVMEVSYSPLQGLYEAEMGIQTNGMVHVPTGSIVTLSAPEVELNSLFTAFEGATLILMPDGCVP